jgi:hypothetical protein
MRTVSPTHHNERTTARTSSIMDGCHGENRAPATYQRRHRRRIRGRAVLTARAVLADRAADSADVVLIDAPFVEGAVAAAAIATTGADLATVRTAAEEARDVRKF